MGRITDALKKVKDERVARIQKKPSIQYVVRKVAHTKIDEHIVGFHDPSSPVGEQYKMLRTNIQSLKYEKNCKTFVLTSAINREGKTVTTINLAMTMAQDVNKKSVLVIDADMRKGTMAKYLGLKRLPGLSEVLQEKTGEDGVFINPGIENLTVMLAGSKPKNPSELLNSKKMEQLLATLKTRFDYIFIDSPPIMPLTDGCILGSMVDGVILVVQAGRTQRETIKHVESRLYQARAKTLGYVLTSMEYHIPRYLYRYVHEYASYDAYYNKDKEKQEAVASS
jgi:capsular exopolysaccharide synthesis family protein